MLIMHIGHISRTQSFQQNRHIHFHALVALKLLVSLISRLVACSARIVVDRQTDRQTDTQTNYCNPRCACAPRVNKKHCCANLAHIYETDNLCTIYRITCHLGVHVSLSLVPRLISKAFIACSMKATGR